MHHFESSQFVYVRRDVQDGVHSAPSPWASRAPWLGQASGGVSLTTRSSSNFVVLTMKNLPSLLPLAFASAQHKRVITRRGLLDPEDEGIALFRKACVFYLLFASRKGVTPQQI